MKKEAEVMFHKDRFEKTEWEEIPDEDLWEDGEISNNTCMIKIYNNVVVEGNWKLIRRKNENNNNNDRTFICTDNR